MRRWKLVNMLQEEGIQLGDLPKYHQLAQSDQSHMGAGRIQPSDGCPTAGSKLQHRSLQLASGALDVTDADPSVLGERI